MCPSSEMDSDHESDNAGDRELLTLLGHRLAGVMARRGVPATESAAISVELLAAMQACAELGKRIGALLGYEGSREFVEELRAFERFLTSPTALA
jgi:hypothetical protein